MKEETLLLRLIHCPVETLGPGKRIGIWFQGCSIRCRGCIAPENQPFDQAFKTTIPDVEVLIRSFMEKNRNLSGVTISGGEPFDQPEALVSLVEKIHCLGLDDILAYSGYRKDVLIRKHPETLEMLAALVDGPFVQGDLSEAAWKGSENQTLTVFKEKYKQKYMDWSFETKGKMQFVHDEYGIFLVGIPRQQDVSTLLSKIRTSFREDSRRRE